MKTTTEKTAANEPLVLATFIACLTEAKATLQEEMRVLAVIATIAEQFDNRKFAVAKKVPVVDAVAAALPEYRVYFDARGYGPFSRIDLSVQDHKTGERIAIATLHLFSGTNLFSAGATTAEIFSRKVVSEKYIRDYDHALDNAEALVSLHNRAQESMKSFYSQMGNALTAVQKYPH